jgi:chitin synthase
MALTVFFLLFFSNIVCPATETDGTIPVNAFGGVVIFGKMYRANTMRPPFNSLFEQTDGAFGGIDVSLAFKREPIAACQSPEASRFKFAQLQSPCEPDSCLDLNDLIQNKGLRELDSIQGFKNKTIKLRPTPAYEWKDVRQRKLVAFQNSVLNFQPYFNENPQAIDGDKVDEFMRLAQQINDATHLMENSPFITGNIRQCLIQKYTAGVLSVLPMSCIMSRLLTWVISGTILSIIFAKFFMALIFDWFNSTKLAQAPTAAQIYNPYANSVASKPILFDDYGNRAPSPVKDGRQRGVAFLMTQPGAKIPKAHPADLFTVCLVTCYSEGEQSIRGTLDSLASTDYDDSKKLLFVISDGLVKGSENPKSTPEILISMMDHDPRFGMQPQPQSYVAVASGPKQHNMAQVYCGSYNYQGRAVPMILIVKCGTPEEKSAAKPGNRGKRDSQLILMNFFSRVTLNDRMTPLDFDIFRKIHHIAGVTPDFYEAVLMVDADTCVDNRSMRYLVNALQNDHSIMGLCGETRIANKRQSWVTRIQVFEYFISHQMGKAFESVFGGVTCLPGCFSMWRIKSENKDGMVLPILGNPDILEQYSTNEVYTLHQKNLLLLGEDRFLTTIMLRQFPNRKTVFVPQAFCKTVVPDDFKTLLSQRRRWINSTVHNLMELVLVQNLCGTFCFSMQVDLINSVHCVYGFAFNSSDACWSPRHLLLDFFCDFRGSVLYG